MDKTVTNDFSPYDLVEMLRKKKQVLSCEVIVHDGYPEILVYVKLKFRYRLWAVLFSDYKESLSSDWGLEILHRLEFGMPEGFTLKLNLVL